MRRLIEEWSSWPDPNLEPLSIVAEDNGAALEFRIYATEHDRYIEHNRAAFLTIAGGLIQTIDLYCAEPQPSARRKGWIAPATMTEDEVRRLFGSYQWVFDIREWIPPHTSGSINLRAFRAGSGATAQVAGAWPIPAAPAP